LDEFRFFFSSLVDFGRIETSGASLVLFFPLDEIKGMKMYSVSLVWVLKIQSVKYSQVKKSKVKCVSVCAAGFIIESADRQSSQGKEK
jgi:hypothetical protein